MSHELTADDLVHLSCANGLIINESKSKEMVIYFGRKINKEIEVSHTVINNRVIDHVESFKLLVGLI